MPLTARFLSPDLSFQEGGTSQAERLPAPLLPEQLMLSDYTMEELLAYIGQFSELVRFYKVADGKVLAEETWSLSKHRSLLIISIIAGQRIEAQYERYSTLIRHLHDKTASYAQRRQTLDELLGGLHAMAAALDDWYSCHGRSRQRRVFQAELEEQVRKLGDALRRTNLYESLLFRLGELDQTRLDADSIADFHTIWHEDPRTKKPTPALQRAQQHEADVEVLFTRFQEQLLKPTDIIRELTGLLWQFHKAQASLARLAHRILQHDLEAKDSLLPEMALMVTFLRLYEHAQRELNDIPRRHLDHYYEKVLQVARRPARPDQAFLSFQLAKDVPAYTVPPGLEVEGGKDEAGNRIVFRTLEERLLTPWRIQQFSSLHVARRAGGKRKHRPVSGIYAAPHANSADGFGARPVPEGIGWAAFGEDQGLVSPAYRTMGAGRVGFAVAAPVLLLQEGHRSIELSLCCEPGSFTRFINCLQSQFAQPGQTWQQAFDHLCLRAFKATVTGPESWLSLVTEEVRIDEATSTVSWRLLLDRNRPAMVAHDPAVHAGQFQSASPVLQLLLNEQSPDYAYSCFALLHPRKIRLRVRARDVQGVQLSNQLGPLDMAMPFAPFGTRAQPGAYLLVGYPELFRKRLTSLTLTLDWLNLPAEGFARYYEAYGQPISNNSYRVTASFLRDWRWVPAEIPARPTPLFDSRAGTDELLPTTRLPLSTSQADFQDNLLPAPLGYRPDAATGFIRLELVSPDIGFGDEQYPMLLSETLQYNARHPSQPRPVPRPPFVPLAKSVALTYSAEEEIEVASLFGPGPGRAQQFYYVHPYAAYEPTRLALIPGRKRKGEKPVPAYSVGLLPDFPDEGTLYLGLSQLALPQTINLLFELSSRSFLSREDSLSCSAGGGRQQPKVRWSYLVEDEWLPFEKGHALHDTSQHFTELGQVFLTLPATLSARHRIMPDGLFWLRATVAKGAGQISRVLAVHPQVVRAERVSPVVGQPVVFEKNLPALSLSRLTRTVPELARVTQPLPSQGGRPAETREQYYTRVSERLRHRHRAVTPWDYERLILEEFPDVYRAKCLRPNQLPARQRKPGQVVVMVLPHLLPASAANPHEYRLPHFSPGRLRQMRKALQPLASPHVRLELCNPLYEVVQVRCQVRYRRDRAGSQEDFFRRRLQRDLAEFLSPWTPVSAARAEAPNAVSGPMVLAFINQLPYVEFTTGFSLVKTALENYQYLFSDSASLPEQEAPGAGEQGWTADDTTRSRPWAVFVSAQHHELVELPSTWEPQAGQPTGIGSLTIENDFAIPFSFDSRRPTEAAD
ncbi:baseplate J/gp47 family protein [Hymenobacter sp. BT175]|uniref:baseplate J/gp47 family protein n=1 Tax=Hymenobacter translucens TaxID=2886507 RepID=UPI001D0E4F88|nr:baseplate J/gp47 family protein [Hymenobacter translucens]MCC2545347.1 baseplate J/gp47 family protein [Hymenobacter translucens]